MFDDDDSLNYSEAIPVECEVLAPLEGTGKGKNSGQPKTASVSGTTTDTATIVLAIGEGEIEGIVGGAKGVYLEGTPIQNADNTFNLNGFDYLFLNGQPTQVFTPVSGNEISSETSVGVAVKSSLPQTRSLTPTASTHLRVRLNVTLQSQDSKGNIAGNTVSYTVSVQEGSGAFTQRVANTANGRYPSGYVITHTMAVGTASSYSIKVEVSTPDSTTNSQRDLSWVSYSAISDRRVDYNNTAIAWMQFSALQFQATPSVWFKVAGIKFRIPTNGVPDANRCINYNVSTPWGGVSNSGGGLYAPAVAIRDPAWILFGLLTNTRYGAGIEIKYIDAFSFYDASQYNMAAVPNGSGGTERRFTFDAVLNDDRPALDVCREVAGMFDAKLFWNGSKLSLWQDRPTGALPRIITNADVVEGNFVYTSQEYSGVVTVVTVWWTDPEQNYEKIPELVEDAGAINRYGVHKESFTALGCTTRGQAIRAGRQIIFKSLRNGELVSFKSRAIALFYAPGDVIQLVDSRRNRRRRAGLIVSATTTSVTIDAPIRLIQASTLYVTMPDGSTQTRAILVTIPGDYTVLSFTTPLAAIPLAQSNWQILDGSEVSKKYRVISVSNDRDNPNLYDVAGTLYDATTYPQTESGWALNAINLEPSPPIIVPPPRNVVAIPRIVGTGAEQSVAVEAQWNFAIRSDNSRETFIQQYIVEYKLGLLGTWTGITTTTELFYTFYGLTLGETYYVRVTAFSYGRQSATIESGPATTAVVVGGTNGKISAKMNLAANSVMGMLLDDLDLG
jgi:predicted phage tail protein